MKAFFARHPLAAPVLAALALRLLAVGAAEVRLAGTGEKYLVAGDAAGYVELAANLADGRDYAVESGVHPRRAMRTPVFPALLSSVIWATTTLPGLLGHGGGVAALWTLRLTVAFCGTAAVWATGRLGETIGGRSVGTLAAWLAAVNPLAVAFSTMILSESLFSALLTISLWGVAVCVRRSLNEGPTPLRWGPAIWAGLAAAGACLTRPVWLPFVPCVALLAGLFAWRARRWDRATWALPFLLAFLIGYAPWPLRNQAVLGEPILTTTWGGPTLYDSLGPQATGASDMRFLDPDHRAIGAALLMDLSGIPPGGREEHAEFLRDADARFFTELTLVMDEKRREATARGEVLTEYTFTAAEDRAAFEATFNPEEQDLIRPSRLPEVLLDERYREAALDAAFADPARVARLTVVKQGRFWRPWPTGGMPGGTAGAVLKTGFAAFFLSLAGLAVWGGVLIWRDRGGEVERVWALALTWGPVLGMAAVCLVFVGSVRYRLPGEFPLAVAAAVGGLDLWRRLKGRRVAGPGG